MGSYPIIQKDEPVGLVELAANAQTTLMNPYFRYLLSQSSGSRGTVKSTLRQLCMLLFKHDRPAEANWGSVDSVTVDLLVDVLRKKRYSPKTCHRYMSVLRGILNKAREVGLLDVNEYHNIKSIRGVSAPSKPREDRCPSWKFSRSLNPFAGIPVFSVLEIWLS